MAETAQERQQKKKWLRLLRRGDHQAFAEFIDKYKETVFLCCRTLGLRDDEIEDVASETFLAAYRAIGRYSGRAKLSTWLWTIAYRRGVSYLRKNRRQLQFEADMDELIGETRESGPAAVQGKETQQILWEAVNRLPKLWAMAVILRYREGKSIQDIAKIMRIRQNTVKTYLFRSREKLRRLLSPAFTEDTDVG